MAPALRWQTAAQIQSSLSTLWPPSITTSTGCYCLYTQVSSTYFQTCLQLEWKHLVSKMLCTLIFQCTNPCTVCDAFGLRTTGHRSFA